MFQRPGRLQLLPRLHVTIEVWPRLVAERGSKSTGREREHDVVDPRMHPVHGWTACHGARAAAKLGDVHVTVG
jgi:hypothetical protein